MNKTILIVEDDTGLLGILSDKFKQEGFNVLTAKDGQEGLEIIAKNNIDIVLLDIVMPKMDGLTMLKKLREEKLEKQPEVIMLTNLSGEDNIAKAMINGSYEYLIKSDWKIEDVVSMVRKKLKE